MRYFFLICFLFTTILLNRNAAAQTKNASGKAKNPVYDAVLSEYKYPYPVKFLPLKQENQQLQMAYMDVAPTKKSGTKPAILLLHGKNFFGAYWRETIKHLTEKGYRVIVPDQIGFGKSTKADLHYSFHQLAQNTRKLLDTLGVEKVVVVGHSMGGMLATRFTLMYPEVVEKLVLENPIGLEDYRPAVPFQPLDESYQKELQNSEEAIRTYFKTYFPVWKPAYDEWVKVPAAQIGSPDFSRVAMASALTFHMIYQQPVVHEFGQLKRPTLLLLGQEDRTVVGKGMIKNKQVLASMGNYPELGKKIAAEIPNGKLVPLPGIGHIPHLEDPAKFHAELLKFVEGK